MPRNPLWTPPSTPFTLADVSPLGVTPTMIARALSAKRVVRLERGVYVAREHDATDPIVRHLQRALAVQLRNPFAIASHTTAAFAWDVDLATDRWQAAAQSPTFIVPLGVTRRSRSNSTYRLHVRDLPAHHRRTLPSGLNVTSPARTAVDVASELTLPEALVSVDAFARGELAGAVGAKRVRRAYEEPRRLAEACRPLDEAAQVASTQFTRAWVQHVVGLADPRRESALESLSFGHMILAGLPLPTLQARVVTPIGESFVDFLWAGSRVTGEADGEGKYRGDEDALVREKRRQEALEQLGYIVVRWTYRELMKNPQAVMARIMRALEARS